jgi:hypothetical protein
MEQKSSHGCCNSVPSATMHGRLYHVANYYVTKFRGNLILMACETDDEQAQVAV